MCTLAVLWKCHPAAPLIVAQCRDELLARPALDLDRWRTPNGVDVVSGRDVVAGGTWFGVGPRMVCALTNRHDALGPRRGTLSRGALVVDALEQTDVAAVERKLAANDGADYGPFSLLACDGDELIYADNSATALVITRVQPGVHVLGNRNLDNPKDPVVVTVGTAVGELVDADEETLVTSLRAILGRHGDGWPCVHRTVPVPGAVEGVPNYGTRSAGVLVWRAQSPRLWSHPSTPHDVDAWRDASALLAPPLDDAR